MTEKNTGETLAALQRMHERFDAARAVTWDKTEPDECKRLLKAADAVRTPIPEDELHCPSEIRAQIVRFRARTEVAAHLSPSQIVDLSYLLYKIADALQRAMLDIIAPAP